MIQWAPMEALLEFITHFGWLAVVLVIFAESGLMVGFFLPGDSLLFVSGTLVQRQIFDVNIFLFVTLLWLAAIAGNSTGYYIGRKFGRRLFNKPDSRFFRHEYLMQAERFYEQYGPKTIVMAMFIPVVRAFAPVVAGIAHMPYARFVAFNLLGATLWVGGFTLLGYWAGDVIQRLGINIEIAALLIIFLSLLPGVAHLLKEPEHRARIKNHIRAAPGKLRRKK